MKILLIAMARNENRYIESWLKHYRKLGVDHVLLYDNGRKIGDSSEERLSDNPYVSKCVGEGFVTLRSLRNDNTAGLQARTYTAAYNEFKSEFDWLMCFDIDEYLSVDGDLKEVLADERYSGYDLIHVNWRLHTDNNSPEMEGDEPYSPKQYYKRLLKNVMPERAFLDREVKSIVRGNLPAVKYLSAHTIASGRCCDCLGRPQKTQAWCSLKVCHDVMRLDHFITKSLAEYIQKKMLPSDGIYHSKSRVDINFFFVYNPVTEDKLDYLEKRFGRKNRDAVSEDIIQSKLRTFKLDFDRQTLDINQMLAESWLNRKKKFQAKIYGRK